MFFRKLTHLASNIRLGSDSDAAAHEAVRPQHAARRSVECTNLAHTAEAEKHKLSCLFVAQSGEELNGYSWYSLLLESTRSCGCWCGWRVIGGWWSVLSRWWRRSGRHRNILILCCQESHQNGTNSTSYSSIANEAIAVILHS